MAGGRDKRGSATRKRRLPYTFVPVPTRVVLAWCEGVLNDDEFHLLVVLYLRASWGALEQQAESTRLTPQQISELLRSKDSWTTIYKRLYRLREAPERWLDWRVQQRRRGDQLYVFRLDPEPRSTSEARPSKQTDRRPSERTAEIASPAQIPAVVDTAPSEAAQPSRSPARSERQSRSSEHPAPAVGQDKPKAGSPAATPVRAPQTVRERANPSMRATVAKEESARHLSSGEPPAGQPSGDGVLDAVLRRRLRRATHRELEALAESERERQFVASFIDEFEAVLCEDPA